MMSKIVNFVVMIQQTSTEAQCIPIITIPRDCNR